MMAGDHHPRQRHGGKVDAQRPGLPLMVTRSRGGEDYVTDGETAQVVPATEALTEDPGGVRGLAERARARASVENDLSAWVAYFAELARRTTSRPSFHTPAPAPRRL